MSALNSFRTKSKKLLETLVFCQMSIVPTPLSFEETRYIYHQFVKVNDILNYSQSTAPYPYKVPGKSIDITYCVDPTLSLESARIDEKKTQLIDYLTRIRGLPMLAYYNQQREVNEQNQETSSDVNSDSFIIKPDLIKSRISNLDYELTDLTSENPFFVIKNIESIPITERDDTLKVPFNYKTMYSVEPKLITSHTKTIEALLTLSGHEYKDAIIGRLRKGWPWRYTSDKDKYKHIYRDFDSDIIHPKEREEINNFIKNEYIKREAEEKKLLQGFNGFIDRDEDINDIEVPDFPRISDSNNYLFPRYNNDDK